MTEEIDILKSWLPSIKLGGYAVMILLVGCIVYGWFNNFTFWHAFADAGFNSSIAHALYYGVFAGPIVFAGVTLTAHFLIKNKNVD